MDSKFSLALVTGASSGIGEALCKLFAKKGISLIVAGRDEKRLDELKKTINQKVSMRIVPGDLSNSQDVEVLVSVIREMMPDLVINSAGFGLYGNALSHSIDQQLKMLDVNSRASLQITLSAVDTLLKNHRSGVVMNISSSAGYQVFPGFSVYAASKAFVNSFSQSLDYEYKEKGIRVLASCPGFIITNFAERAAAHCQKGPSSRKGMDVEYAAEEIWQQIQRKKPLRIFNWKYRIAAALSHFIPTSCLAPLLHREIYKRIKN
ncbi:hypothetical protein PHSC3_001017 [Chlamydiales bacterium STE3]|nr:hypothetical protein PHSC3_001017 [Chlamydiales bacterium STE3]